MTKCKPLPSREELLEHLHYDSESGLFWWATGRKGRQLSRPVGNFKYACKKKEPSGIQIMLNYQYYMAHRLAWRMMTGDDPDELTIDHINRNPFDNRWENLRLADNSLQQRNKRNRGESTHKGVCFDRSRGKWLAQVKVNGGCKNLGRFATEAAAAEAAAPYFIP